MDRIVEHSLIAVGACIIQNPAIRIMQAFIIRFPDPERKQFVHPVFETGIRAIMKLGPYEKPLDAFQPVLYVGMMKHFIPKRFRFLPQCGCRFQADYRPGIVKQELIRPFPIFRHK
jgi:hypothetical protein